MKEYKIVCDITHILCNGQRKTYVDQKPLGSTGNRLGLHPFYSREEAEEQLKKYIEWGQQYMDHIEQQRKFYPKLYEKVEMTNYRIKSREVTAWQDDI